VITLDRWIDSVCEPVMMAARRAGVPEWPYVVFFIGYVIITVLILLNFVKSLIIDNVFTIVKDDELVKVGLNNPIKISYRRACASKLDVRTLHR
jgi:hypothetical protein